VSDSGQDDRFVTIGRFSGLYGVKGWLKVYSHTRPKQNILQYRPWYVRTDQGWELLELQQGRSHGKGVVVKPVACDDRDQAAALLERDIAVKRSQFPRAEDDSFYWVDLEGLQVVTLDGRQLGRIDHLFETGANDVMVVEGDRERLIPFTPGQTVVQVDLQQGVVQVDWDADF
jgi:16S rRNA processing protein RimM